MTGFRARSALHLAALLSGGVLLFQPDRMPLGVFFVGRVPSLIDFLALAVPILTVALAAGSTVNRGPSGTGVLTTALHSLAIAVSALGPIAAGCGIIAVPPIRAAFFSLYIVVLALGAGHLAAITVALIPGPTLRHLVVWMLLLGVLVLTALFAPVANPVVCARAVLGEGRPRAAVVYLVCTLVFASVHIVVGGRMVRTE